MQAFHTMYVYITIPRRQAFMVITGVQGSNEKVSYGSTFKSKVLLRAIHGYSFDDMVFMHTNQIYLDSDHKTGVFIPVQQRILS
jgi:hypothetical protein